MQFRPPRVLSDRPRYRPRALPFDCSRIGGVDLLVRSAGGDGEIVNPKRNADRDQQIEDHVSRCRDALPAARGGEPGFRGPTGPHGSSLRIPSRPAARRVASAFHHESPSQSFDRVGQIRVSSRHVPAHRTRVCPIPMPRASTLPRGAPHGRVLVVRLLGCCDSPLRPT